MFYELQESVTISGNCFWARPATITFSPNEDPNDPWWYWQPFVGGEKYKITPKIARMKPRRIQLFAENQVLETWEHLGAVRYFIPCGITVTGRGWPPHAAGMATYLEALLSKCREMQRKPKLYTLERQAKWSYPEPRGGKTGMTLLSPSEQEQCATTISFNYQKSKASTDPILIPLGTDCLRSEIFSARTPHLQSPLSPKALWKLLKMIGWPRETINWAYDKSPEDFVLEIARHRALDILGALSLVGKDGLFIANVHSINSGHEADLEVVTKAWKERSIQLQGKDPGLTSILTHSSR